MRGSSGYGRAFEMADNREKRADWLKDLTSINTWARSQAWTDPTRIRENRTELLVRVARFLEDHTR